MNNKKQQNNNVDSKQNNNVDSSYDIYLAISSIQSALQSSQLKSNLFISNKLLRINKELNQIIEVL